MNTFKKADAAETESTILSTIRTATFKIGDKAHSLTFDRTELTPRLNRKLLGVKLPDEATEEQIAAARESSDDAACEYLSTVVLEWDVTDKHGAIVPLTTEAVSGLSYKTINLIMKAINSPNAEAATDEHDASPA